MTMLESVPQHDGDSDGDNNASRAAHPLLEPMHKNNRTIQVSAHNSFISAHNHYVQQFEDECCPTSLTLTRVR